MLQAMPDPVSRQTLGGVDYTSIWLDYSINITVSDIIEALCKESPKVQWDRQIVIDKFN